MNRKRVAVLISGRGSNLQAIIDAIAARRLEARIAVVISNRSDAAGLVRAQDAGMPEGLARVLDILQTSIAPKSISPPALPPK